MKHAHALLLFVLSVSALAAERPNDFAYGSMLEADGSDALYAITLPAAVYQGVTRQDLGDVRVFNGAGEVVPHAWRPRRIVSTEAPQSVALTLFPLKAQAGTRVDGLAISVRRSAGGATTVDVRTEDGRAAPASATIGYLIDVGAEQRPLQALDLDWQTPADGFAGRMRVDASDDLRTWRTVVADAPLVSLEVGGQRLQQKRIEFAAHKARYLRLSWSGENSARPPQLTSARAQVAERTVEAPREWTRVGAVKGEKPGEYVFDVRGYFPVDRVSIDLPEPNTIVQIELLVRDKVDQPWRPIVRGVAYRLRQGGTEVTSPELAVNATSRYWLLRVDQRGGGIGAGAPRLAAGWVPHQLVFTARGAAPFQLVYGNRNAASTAYAIETMIPGYKDEAVASIRTAKAGEQQTVDVRGAQAHAQRELGGDARRQEAIDWKRWSLWGALVLGVALLGGMAWRLSRQIRMDNAAPPRTPDQQ